MADNSSRKRSNTEEEGHSINSLISQGQYDNVDASVEPGNRSSDISAHHPEIIEVIKHYDMKTTFKKTLLLVSCELRALNAAKIIVERIIEDTFSRRDVLSEYLRCENLVGTTARDKLNEYVNRKDNFGIAPIHVAAHTGSLEVFNFLTANGANPYLKTDEGLSLIHLAAEGDSVNAIYYFKNKFNIDVDEKDDKGSTPLHWAVFEGCELALTFLISWGADVNAQDQDGHTPLHIAVDYAEKEQNSRMVKLLLLKGADRDIKNIDGNTPSDIITPSEMQAELESILSKPCFLACCMLKMPLK